MKHRNHLKSVHVNSFVRQVNWTWYLRQNESSLLPMVNFTSMIKGRAYIYRERKRRHICIRRQSSVLYILLMPGTNKTKWSIKLIYAKFFKLSFPTGMFALINLTTLVFRSKYGLSGCPPVRLLICLLCVGHVCMV